MEVKEWYFGRTGGPAISTKHARGHSSDTTLMRDLRRHTQIRHLPFQSSNETLGTHLAATLCGRQPTSFL